MKEKKLYGLLLALFVIFGLSLSLYSKVNASSKFVVDSGYRTYYYPTGGVTRDALRSTVTSTGQLPFNIIGGVPSGNNYISLLGIQMYGYVSGGSTSNKYNSVRAYFHFVQYKYYSYNSTFNLNGSSPKPVMYAVDNSNQVYDSSCSIDGQDADGIRWVCVATTSNYNPITAVSFSWNSFSGQTVSDGSIAYLGNITGGGMNYNALQAYNAYYDYTTTADALIVGQNTIIDQNTTIINQNDTIINQQQEALDRDTEDRDNIESQQGETNSSAEESSEDLNEGTTNLIGALSSFFTTMSNVSAGNCTLPEITAYGVSLGQLNLCTYSPPVWIQTALSVIVSLIAIRLAYAIFKRIIKIVKSFTGGNG